MSEISILEAILLGIVQGFTEWLPISSSGHLVLIQSLLGISVPAAFDIVIMVGTIIALIIYFRQTLISLAQGIYARDRIALRYCFFIIIAGIGTALIGFFGKTFFKGLFYQPFLVSCLLIVTGIFLFIASKAKSPAGEMTAKKSFIIGIAQGIAVAPGISRSGSTIGAALLLGIKAEDAAVFSFLIGIPAMTIASFVTLLEEPAVTVTALPLAVATVTAFITGYASIELLMRLLKENRFILFAYYCIGAGLLFAVLTYHV
ncbi:MAG: undecaprenyl-diphosphate phosphatase [Methanoregulaceae archaeon]|nr:MAG: undecaprenyl-diphosphate phosphatase [Methanoregulaceae archaeon]